MSGEEADLLLTDPPYNVAIGQTGGRSERTDGKIIANDNMPADDFYNFLYAFFSIVRGSIKQGAAFYVWHATSSAMQFLGAMEDAGLQVRQNLVWVKNNFTLGRQDYQWKHEPCLYGWKDGAAHYFVNKRNISTVFEDKPDLQSMTKGQLIELIKEIQDGNDATTVLHEDKPMRNEEHPTMKPIKLISRLILNSTEEGQLVLDPFGGSGTTLIAAEQLNRRCYMMELDPQYADVILARWEKLTGEEAIQE